jgi:Ribonucleotide reductase, barrel domain
MKNKIIAHNGSVQNISNIPDDIKTIYKTVWEISQKKVLDLAADRGAFICQSQSLNVHLQLPSLGQLTSMHLYEWKKRDVLRSYKACSASHSVYCRPELVEGGKRNKMRWLILRVLLLLLPLLLCYPRTKPCQGCSSHSSVIAHKLSRHPIFSPNSCD